MGCDCTTLVIGKGILFQLLQGGAVTRKVKTADNKVVMHGDDIVDGKDWKYLLKCNFASARLLPSVHTSTAAYHKDIALI
jgi:hypothetical protein